MRSIGSATSAGSTSAPSKTKESVGIKISPSPTSAACTFQAGQADCWSNPFKGATVTLVWPAGGSYTLAVTADRDKHGRQFNPPKIMQLAINVQ
jgi:hypothetical protein